MWVYDKKTEYPINIRKPDPRMAKLVLTQYGGPNGELAASLRYLSQRFAMPNKESKAILTDIGTEELAHFEMVGAIVHQLVNGVPPQDLERYGFDTNYAVHGKGVYPSDSNGVPFTAAYIESMSDPIANLNEDLAAEQKARATYEYLIRMADDPDVIDPLRFLREREVVHYQRFGEALRITQELMGKKKMYYSNPNMPIMPNMQNNAPDMMNIPNMSNTMSMAQAKNIQMPQMKQMPETKPAPVMPEMKPAPVMPEMKPAPVMPEMKNAPSPVMPEMKHAPVMPEMKNAPMMPQMKTSPAPVMPEMKNAPMMPEMKNAPMMPEMKNAPMMPEMKNAPMMPEMKNMPNSNTQNPISPYMNNKK